jgi:hypothetical protein
MKQTTLSLFGLAILTSVAVAQDHGHLNVGAVGTNQNDQLIFDNASAFSTTNDYVKTLLYATSGTYAGYYQGNITFTALAATADHLGPVPNAPALGSRIFAELVSVSGPAGGAFAFWDTGATSPAISLATGTSGTNTFRLSENDGSPGSDPYGHIHGRRFTATKPGFYTVAFRAWDFSTNGLAGGPIHTPSEVLKVYFQAGDNIQSAKPSTNQFLVRFGARLGFSWQVEATPSLTMPDWQVVSSPVIGDDYIHEISDGAMNTNRFYRLNGTPMVP